MNFPPAFVDEGRGLEYTPQGELTADDVLAVKRSLFAEPQRLKVVTHALIRLDGVTRFAATAAEIQAIADIDAQLARLLPGMIVAVVAPTDVLFGMARMWEGFADATGWRIAVFRSLAEAQDWIRTEATPHAG